MASTVFIYLVDAPLVTQACLASSMAWLGEAELALYRRFVRQERRRQFVIGRVLARQALGTLLGEAAATLVIEKVDGAGPRRSGPRPVFFSFPTAATGLPAQSAPPPGSDLTSKSLIRRATLPGWQRKFSMPGSARDSQPSRRRPAYAIFTKPGARTKPVSNLGWRRRRR